MTVPEVKEIHQECGSCLICRLAKISSKQDE